jgi:tetratricopeptide (TPR) repeat protein
MDVQRYLADEPVLACPPSVGYRLQKLIRRNKGPIVAAFLVLFSMLAGTVVSVWLAVRADQERRIAEAREAETKAVLDFLEKKVLAAARPEGQEGGLGHDVTLRQAIEAALPLIETSFKDQPLIEARLRATAGLSFLFLGEPKTAAEQFQQARTIYTQHLGPDHPVTLDSVTGLATSYGDLGRYSEAFQLFDEALVLQKAKLGPDHPDTLQSMSQLAAVYTALGRQADALQLHQKTLALRRGKLGLDHPDTLVSMQLVADCLQALGRHAAALKLREEALPHLKTKLGIHHPHTLLFMDLLADNYVTLGRHADALKLLEASLALRKARLGPDHPDMLQSMNNLADTYAALGRHADALKLHEETLALRTAKLCPDHPDTVSSMNSLAWLLATCPDPNVRNKSRAVELAKKAVELVSNEGNYWNTLGAAHYRSGDGKAAIAALEKSMGLRKGGDSFDWFFLAMAHCQLGDKEGARKWYDRAVEWMRKNQPSDEQLRRFRAEAGVLLGLTEKHQENEKKRMPD